ncbi:MAG: ATP-binding protein [Bacteroidetes bacterium]|nr:ATP-binding protein [Bacteroidota bacterium]
MIKLWKKFDMYYRLSKDDLLNRQRYVLFRIITVCVIFVTTISAFQTYYDLAKNYYIIGFLASMTVLGVLNYVSLQFHYKTKVAYSIIILTAFFSIHALSYIAGGIRDSGMLYYCVLALISYMLLGKKGGIMMSALLSINLIYFYYVTENTNWVSNLFLKVGGSHGVNQDFLITGLLSMSAISALATYIERNKNIVIAKISASKDELEIKNIELEKLSIVASRTDNAVIITDKNCLTEWVNESFTTMTGYRLEDIKGLSPDALLFGEETDLLTILRKTEKLEAKQTFIGEFLQYDNNKNVYWAHVTITPTLDENFNVSQYIFIEADITERKIAQQKQQEYLESLEKTNKELEQFAYVVSHDLKAPLRAIGNLSTWIEEDLGDEMKGEMASNFNMMRGRVARMENLINGILDYSRINKSLDTSEKINTRNLILDTIDLIGQPDGFRLELHDNLPTVYGERVKLQQVFSNLISNAIKYNDKENGKVEISVSDKGDDWEFTIEDNGPGIDKKYHNKIFVIFQTLQARDNYESTGVGLAIVKKIVEQYGGTISCDSEEGNGAKFIFTWPKKPLGEVSQMQFKQSPLSAA